MVDASMTISASDAALFIRNREGFYESLEYFGYHLPSLHSSLCTLEWMWYVKAGTYYCPKENALNHEKKCFRPPPIEDMIAKLESVLRPIIDANKQDPEAKAVSATLS